MICMNQIYREEIEFVIQKNKDDIVFYLEETTTTSSGFYLTIYVKNNKTDKFYLSNTSYYGDDKFIIGKDYTLKDTQEKTIMME